KRKVCAQEVRDGRPDKVRPSGLRMHRSEGRRMGQILQRILQEPREQNRAPLRVPPPGLPLTAAAIPPRPSMACAIVLAVALPAMACSNAAVDKAAGAGAGSGIAVTTSAMGLAIENHTTRPLLNVRVSVTAA